MNTPLVRRLGDITNSEKMARNIYRNELSKIDTSKDLASCRKPVWISCFFDGTGNNYYKDGYGSLRPEKEKYSNCKS